MVLKNRKIVPLLLISSIMVTNLGLTSAYAYNITDIVNKNSISVVDYNFIETSNGFIMEYEQIEDNKAV